MACFIFRLMLRAGYSKVTRAGAGSVAAKTFDFAQ